MAAKMGTHMKNTREKPSQRVAEKCSWAPVAELPQVTREIHLERLQSLPDGSVDLDGKQTHRWPYDSSYS